MAWPPVPDEPPDDPEAWTDEEWLAWLARTDAGATDDDGGQNRVVARWRDRSGSQVLGAAMLGLRDAIYGRPGEEIVIVEDASGDPPGDEDTPVVHLDPDSPQRSEVVVRRRDGGGGGRGGA
jgi:hypothetical protein